MDYLKILFIIFLCCSTSLVQSQVYMNKKGQVSFESATSLQTIISTNNRVACMLNLTDQSGQFLIPIQGFEFESKLMREHFNENYLFTEKFPNASYKFTFDYPENMNWNIAGSYLVTTTGILTIKGISKKVQIPGKINILDANRLHITADFNITLADYGIQIPKIVQLNISPQIKSTVNSILYKRTNE